MNVRFCPCWDQYHSAEGSVYISRAFWLSRTPPSSQSRVLWAQDGTTGDLNVSES